MADCSPRRRPACLQEPGLFGELLRSDALGIGEGGAGIALATPASPITHSASL